LQTGDEEILMNQSVIKQFTLCLLMSSAVYAGETKTEIKKEHSTGKSSNKTVLKYNKRALFTEKDEQGRHRVLEYEDKKSKIDREAEKLDHELQQRSRTLQQAMMEERNTPQMNPSHMAKLAKEQNALQIDADFLQKEYSAQVAKLQAEMEDKIKEVIDELREELGVGGIEAADFKSSSYSDDLDITKMVIKKLNDQYRAEQRAKKFGAEAAKSETSTKKS
jgi:hypothetical protein